MLEALMLLAADACAIPPDLTPAPVERSVESRVLPIEKYVLAWYWWPENCAKFPGEGCTQKFGFKVHGLWPDGAGETYPQYCRPASPLPLPTVREHWCMTPAVSLLQHEWAKHGTCNWATPDAYFIRARKISERVRMPDADRLPAEGLNAGKIRDAVLALNPQLPRAALFVGTDKRQRLTEVRLCLDLAYKPAACEGGQVGAPDRVPVQVRKR